MPDSPLPNPDAPALREGGGALASPEQRLVEERAIGIFADPQVKAAADEMRALFRADRNAKLAGQEALMERSVMEHMFHACLVAANETPLCPRFVWTIALQHDWMGLSVPGSRFGQDNTDNIYRLATIDPLASYRISGRFSPERPSDFSICALPAQIGENMAADVVGFISIDSIDVAADGSFAIDVDASPTDGRRNHLSIARARSLMVRDTMANWASETPSYLAITRTDGPSDDDFDAATAARRAADLGTIIARFFLANIQHGMFEVAPLNAIPEPVASAGRGGLVTQCATGGYYRLGDGEALVITADPLGARYLGMQIVDMWMLSFDYRDRCSSLNHHQARKDSDGKYRWVISASDPGVHNWLDGSGHACGSVLIRWQHLPPGVALDGCVSADIVSLNALRAFLPSDSHFVDAAGRAAQRAERTRQYDRRLTA